MNHSLGTLLAQNNDQNHEQAIYYLSRIMIGAEHRYNLIKKECLALVFAIQKMRHYLVGQHIHVISRVNPLRLLMTRPSSLNYRLAKWAILLSWYEMQFIQQKAIKGQSMVYFLANHLVPQKAIKGQSMVYFLANHLVPGTSKLYDDLPDEIAEVNMINVSSEVWWLFFDGASKTSPERNIIAGVGVVLIFFI